MGKLQRMRDDADKLLGRSWLACWDAGGARIVDRRSTPIKRYDYDEEFRHLGYTASLVGGSRAAEHTLARVARRAACVFRSKPGLQHCGASIVTSCLVPKVAYPGAFAKTPLAAVTEATAQLKSSY